MKTFVLTVSDDRLNFRFVPLSELYYRASCKGGEHGVGQLWGTNRYLFEMSIRRLSNSFALADALQPRDLNSYDRSCCA